MSVMNLDSILEAVQMLTPDEQRQLRARLDERLTQQGEAAKLQAFHQALVASGLVTTIKARRASPIFRTLVFRAPANPNLGK